jgi:hypothetical protein
MANISAKIAALFMCVTMVGCATSRSEIELGSPQKISSGSVASSRQTAVIRTIKDERVFQQDSRNPSVPSLGFEGSALATAETKARAVGRKRNTYGKALGDVLLRSGQTVEGVIREYLASALEQAGYQIKSEDVAGPLPLLIDVHITQFWSWFLPGFWSITLNTNIATDLDLSGTAAPVTVSVHAEDSRQVATDSAWVNIIGKALEAYRTQVITKAADFPKSGQGVGAHE